MISGFKIYVYLTILGLLFRLSWDLNHSYKWLSDGDRLYGAGSGLILVGCAIYIASTKKKGWQKVFTRVFFYTAISNLCDEILFDPFRVSWEEWVSALFVLVIVYIYENKEKVMSAWEELGWKFGIFMSGCAGAVASFMHPQKLKWHERALTIFVGGLSAMYITPFAVSVVGILHDVGSSAQLFLGFLIGYSGLKSIEVAIVQVKKRFKK